MSDTLLEGRADYVAHNLALVKEDIHAAEAAAGRVGKTALIAAVKYGEDAEIDRLLSLGVADVGENRVQQLLSHMPLYEKHGTRIHFIGTLQKNKIKYIIDKVYAIHSVDSLSLAEEINKHAAKRGISVRVLAEVNIGREAAKSGAMPEELTALCEGIAALPNLSLLGVMTMAPRCETPADYHQYFSEARTLAEAVWQSLSLQGRPLLSMGMSESFGAAIAEGADMVRVGRRLFLKEEN